MKKNDRVGLRLETLAFWESGKAAKNLGFGLSYRGLPGRPYANPVAYLLREFVWFNDAVGAWSAWPPEIHGIIESETRLAQAKAEKKRCARVIIAALGPYLDDLDAAETAMDDWCSSARSIAGLLTGDEGLREEFVPVMVPVWEINTTLRPLLEAYRNPRQFFCEIAPRVWAREFDFGPNDWQQLAATLHEWGQGAHLNVSVQAALQAAADQPLTLAKVLGRVEGRRAYKEGRPRSRRKLEPEFDGRRHRGALLGESLTARFDSLVAQIRDAGGPAIFIAEQENLAPLRELIPGVVTRDNGGPSLARAVICLEGSPSLIDSRRGLLRAMEQLRGKLGRQRRK